MPHYKNGQLAHINDLVVCKPEYQGAKETIGMIVQILATSDSCNANLIPFAKRWDKEWHTPPVAYQECVSIKDCLLLVPDQMSQMSKPEAQPLDVANKVY